MKIFGLSFLLYFMSLCIPQLVTLGAKLQNFPNPHDPPQPTSSAFSSTVLLRNLPGVLQLDFIENNYRFSSLILVCHMEPLFVMKGGRALD